MLLDGKVAMITGAAQGIGLAIAERFSAEGAAVAVTDVVAAKIESAAVRLGGDAVALHCNVVDEDSVETAVEAVVTRFDRLDVLVNNAGITRDGMLHRMDLADFRAVIDVHLQGAWLCSRAAMRHMRAREGGGAIVNMSSISGKVGNLGQTNYAAAKAGIVALTKSTAREGARFGIRANSILPGLIRTEMTEAMPSDSWSEKMAGIPLGRAGEPLEVANVALFLASDLASYVTGATIEVTGGRHM